MFPININRVQKPFKQLQVPNPSYKFYLKIELVKLFANLIAQCVILKQTIPACEFFTLCLSVSQSILKFMTANLNEKNTYKNIMT